MGREGERHSPPQRQHLTRRAGAQRQASYSGQKCYRFNEDKFGNFTSEVFLMMLEYV